jgi:hypothetical protein
VEKLIYLLSRKDGWSRKEFFDHYFHHHSVLGMRTCLFMDGYTLNFTDVVDPGPGAPDSITEIWTRDAGGFLDPARAFRSEEEKAELVADDRSFIGRNLRYSVDEEVVRGVRPAGQLRTRTPGVKRISLHTGASRPPIAPGVTCVVEQHVREVISPDAPVVDVFVFEWAPSADVFAPLSVPAYLTTEYRQRDVGTPATAAASTSPAQATRRAMP